MGRWWDVAGTEGVAQGYIIQKRIHSETEEFGVIDI